MSLDNIFCGVARDSVKDVEINNNIEVNSFTISRVNLQLIVRVQKYNLLQGYRKRLCAIFGIE